MNEPLGMLSERLDPQLRRRAVAALCFCAAALLGIAAALAVREGIEAWSGDVESPLEVLGELDDADA